MNNKDADQLAQPHSLISTSVVCCLKSFKTQVGLCSRASQWVCLIWFEILHECILMTNMSTHLCNPKELHFCEVKLGFTGVYINFLFLLKTCGYLLETHEAVLKGTHNLYCEKN